eukprot:5209986-Pleurochrysis_carterae.AAC.2
MAAVSSAIEMAPAPLCGWRWARRRCQSARLHRLRGGARIRTKAMAAVDATTSPWMPLPLLFPAPDYSLAVRIATRNRIHASCGLLTA